MNHPNCIPEIMKYYKTPSLRLLYFGKFIFIKDILKFHNHNTFPFIYIRLFLCFVCRLAGAYLTDFGSLDKQHSIHQH